MNWRKIFWVIVLILVLAMIFQYPVASANLVKDIVDFFVRAANRLFVFIRNLA